MLQPLTLPAELGEGRKGVLRGSACFSAGEAEKYESGLAASLDRALEGGRWAQRGAPCLPPCVLGLL